jgi:aryl-alcohol dehydrogenase-like predicted oxidoreductase
MQYTGLGRAAVRVSRLCLGTMNFGPWADEVTSHAIMDTALDRGINFFDTANVYGSWDDGDRRHGETEEIIGRWLAKGGGRRERIVLATKVHGRMGPDINDEGLSARHIRHAVDASLRRLQTDHIDVYQMHHVRLDVTWDEVWQACELLVQQGKILYVGSSNFGGWHLAMASEIARQRHFLGLVSEQSLYNLLQRTIELEVVPACQHYGIGLLPWGPLEGGLLAGALAKEQDGRRALPEVRADLDRWRDRIERYEALCREIGTVPAQVGIAWLLAQPAVTAPIIGPRTVEQLITLADATSVELVATTLEQLDEIFPGPGGPAPQAYAW